MTVQHDAHIITARQHAFRAGQITASALKIGDTFKGARPAAVVAFPRCGELRDFFYSGFMVCMPSCVVVESMSDNTIVDVVHLRSA